MSEKRDPRLQELERLKAILDRKWKANEHVLMASLGQGLITWRRTKTGGFEVTLKPSID